MHASTAFGASSTQNTSERRNVDGIPDNIDFMTGRFHEEKPDPFAGMTDEEKEREAESSDEGKLLENRNSKTFLILQNPNRYITCLHEY